MSHNLHSKSTFRWFHFDQNFRRRFRQFKDQSTSEIEIFSRWIGEVQYKIPSEYISQSFKIQRFNTETKQFQCLFEEPRIPVLSKFLIHSIRVYWKRKSYLSWEDLIKKFCLPIELVWRQDIRTAQNINNKGFSPETPEISLQRLNSKI